MSNSHLEREAERAAAELERRLRPWLPDSLRQQFAERFIADLIAEHWRHIPPPVDEWRTSRKASDPAAAHARIEEIKAALRTPGGQK